MQHVTTVNTNANKHACLITDILQCYQTSGWWRYCLLKLPVLDEFPLALLHVVCDVDGMVCGLVHDLVARGLRSAQDQINECTVNAKCN